VADDLTLASDFAAPTRDEWLAAVDRALKGADFDKTLMSTTDDGIRVAPLYVAGDVAVAADEAGFPAFAPLLRGAVAAPRPDGVWDIRTSIAHPDPATANAWALEDLAGGATSVEFHVADAADVPDLFSGIVLDAAPVAVRGGVPAARALLALTEPGATPRGSLGIDPVGADADLAEAVALAVEVAARTPNLRTLLASGPTVADAGGSEAQEIGYLLGTATAYLRELTEAGLSVDGAARQIELEVAADVDIFTTIAKIRALRFTWAAVLQQSGVAFDGDHDGIVHISAVSSYRTLTVVDPWVNLLRGTAACLGAVLGGADTVTIAAFDGVDAQPGPLGRRLARNTQLILADESGIGRVLDPAGGSWYVESLTDALAAKAWEVFQRIEAAGGPRAAMPDLAEQIAAVAAQRDRAIARRRRPITGVSEFPLLGEQRPDQFATTPPASGPLPRRRLAEPFERLRAAGEQAGATIFLANLGPLAVHTARATFAANLFAAGGVRAVPTAVDPDTVAAAFAASGARVACICSSDEVYAEQAPAVAAALREAGAARIYLAGKADIPGVDERISLGMDALDALQRLHQTLEIA
jgi:methylmalonyl-CoA mutase